MEHEITFIIPIISSAITFGLLVVIIIQTGILKKQIHQTNLSMNLAYAPFIMPRYVQDVNGQPTLHLKNIGNGSAKDVHIKIKTPDGKMLSKVDRFAFMPNDKTHNTLVNLKENPSVKIEGKYCDITNREYVIDKNYNYPPTDGSIEN